MHDEVVRSPKGPLELKQWARERGCSLSPISDDLFSWLGVVNHDGDSAPKRIRYQANPRLDFGLILKAHEGEELTLLLRGAAAPGLFLVVRTEPDSDSASGHHFHGTMVLLEQRQYGQLVVRVRDIQWIAPPEFARRIEEHHRQIALASGAQPGPRPV